jgi:hypothetical protein
MAVWNGFKNGHYVVQNTYEPIRKSGRDNEYDAAIKAETGLSAK